MNNDYFGCIYIVFLECCATGFTCDAEECKCGSPLALCDTALTNLCTSDACKCGTTNSGTMCVATERYSTCLTTAGVVDSTRKDSETTCQVITYS